jgi:hypothetical protein
MANTYKSLAMMRELADLLAKESAAAFPVQTESFDTAGNPVLTLSADSTPAAGEKVVVIRIQPTEADYAKDILGNAALRFSPHVIQMITELGASAPAEAACTAGDLHPITVECARKGMIFERYQSANGTLPATAEMTAANLKSTWRDLYFNIQKSQ